MAYFNQQSDRLNFRKLQANDFRSWSEFFENNPNLSYLGLINEETKGLSNIELAKLWIDKQFQRYETTGLGLLALISKQTGEFIGQAGVSKKKLNDETCYEIAYSIKPIFWGKGYASEASKKIIDYVKENNIAENIISIIHVENIGSQKVAERNQMKVINRTNYMEMDVFVYGRPV